MNIFDPLITGSLSVSGSGEISGDLTVLGTINATISGTTSNAITASEAPKYTLTSSFDNFTGSYTTGSFTGSFIGDGGDLYNIPASGVTGLNLTQIADGNVTASVSNTNGLRVNSKSEITGSLIVTEGITGSIDYSNITNKPTLVSGSSQIDITGTTGYSTFSSSISSSVGSLSSSIATTNLNQDGRLSSLETASGSNNTVIGTLQTATSSLNTFTSSTSGRLTSIETSTGSLNVFSSSTNTRLGSIETETGSIRTNFNTYTSSNNTTNTTQNSRLTSLEGKSGSYATTGSNNFIGTQTITGSLYISQNLIVQGSSSLENITASAVSIGTNTIILNTDTPAFRYAGISVFDSGSTNVTASLFYDSLTNQWKFKHTDTGTNDASIVLFGPLGNNIDNAPLLDGNYITKVENNSHGHHLTTSSILDNGSKVSINSNTEITGSLTGTGATFSGNVGIGTVSPSQKLEVNGGSVSTYAKVSRDTGYLLLGAGLSFSAIYARNNTDAPRDLYIEASKVGIGTTSPNQLLEISGEAGDGITPPTLRITNTSENGSTATSNVPHHAIEFYQTETSGNYPAVAAAIKTINQSSFGAAHGLAFYTNANAVSPTERMRITSGGNVLINTQTDAGFRLDVVGTGRFSDTISTTNGTVNNLLSYTTTDGVIGTQSNHGVVIRTNNLDRLTIASTGAATFSSSVTAGDGTQTPEADATITIRKGVAFAGLDLKSTRTSGNIGGIRFYDSTNTLKTQILGEVDSSLVFYTNTSSERLRITSGGLIGIGTTSPQAPLHVIAASTSDNALIQEWSYTNATTDQYSLMLKQTVTSGVVRYNFSMVNNNIAYDNVLVLDRGNIGIGTTSPTFKLDVDGTGRFSGNVTANLTGNATTATTLQTAITIGGVSFNGSANINLPGVNTAGNQNTTGTAANVTGTVAIANGGTGGITASAARTNLGATTLGGNLFTLVNVASITFPRFNADNTVSSLDAATFRTAIGAGTSSTVGTVTSVGGTGTVSGLSLSGTVTSTGNLTLGGTLSLTSGNVTTALGFTPYNATNPNGYITGVSFNGISSKTGGTGTYQTSGDFRAPIFYDSANTAYYFDGSSTGDSIRVAGDVVAYYSDERLKDIKENIPNAINKVLSLNGFYYEPNEIAQKLGYKKKLEIGLSAQEVERILPEIIKDAPIGHGYKTLDYGKLTPLLVEAIKEQQQQIEELKTLINNLTK
jgi:hypothetical protein